MNERTWRDRWHAVGPLILRTGVAAVLIWTGLTQLDVLRPLSAGAPSGVTALADSPPSAWSNDGVAIRATWPAVMGLVQCVGGGVLIVGLLTRVAAGLLLGGCVLAFLGELPGVAATPATLGLLAAAGLSLIASGGGALALRRRTRYVLLDRPVAPGPPPPHNPRPYREPREPDFVRPREPLGTRMQSVFRGWRDHWRRPARRHRRGWRWWQVRAS